MLDCAVASTELLDDRLAGIVAPTLAANGDAQLTFRQFVEVMAPVVEDLGGGARLYVNTRACACQWRDVAH